MIKPKGTHWYTDWKCWLSAFFLVTILPYLILIFYSFPLPGDDIVYSISARHVWTTTGQIIPTIQAAWQHTMQVYQSWQGSLSGVFIMALNPAVFSITAYRLALLFINLAFIAGIFRVTRYFVNEYISLPKFYPGLISAIIIFSCYHFMPSLHEFLYWFNGSSYYLLSLTVLLFASVLLHKSMRNEKPAILSWGLLSLVAIFTGLNNLPLLMTTFTLLFFTTAFLFIKKSRKKYAVLFLLILLIASAVVNITAPGNAHRILTEKTVDVSLIKTVILSFYAALKGFAVQFGRLTFVPILLVLVTPAIKKHIDASRVIYMNPLLLLTLTFLVIVSQYTVTVFTMDENVNYGRVTDFRYILYQIAIVVNYLNLLCYLTKTRKKADNSPSKPISQRIARLTRIGFIVYAILAAVFSIRLFFVYPSNPVDLYQQITTHQLKTYSDEQAARFEIAENAVGQDVVFKKLTYPNVLIGIEKLTPDPNFNINSSFAEFYHLNSVVVEE